MLVLGIESSCDETAASLVEIKKEKIKIISNVVSSQIKIHQKYGGVVPEVAARAHLENILPVITKALKNNNKKNIDLISVTIGPGLITSLLIGIETAKTLAYLWNKPIIGVNHLEGHIYANFIDEIFNFKFLISKQIQKSVLSLLKDSKFQLKTDQSLTGKIQKIQFPALCLIVSGGHTELILMKDHLKYKKIGQTKDDAAGEAFDKVAKMLNLSYPGGPTISAEAVKFSISKKPQAINYKLISLPRPMIYSNDYNFSFSGLKTAVLYQLKKDKDWKKKISEYCYEFQQAIIDVLIFKTLKATKEYKVKTIILSGGVAANNKLRKQFLLNIKRQMSNVKFLVPQKNLCVDNAAMIAVAGYFNFLKKKNSHWQKLKPNSNLDL
jgi:N6-L-threonylcarbamoyladenine synthase